MSAPEYCRVAKEEDKASSVSPLAAPSVSNSLEETQLLEAPPEVREEAKPTTEHKVG